MQIRKRGSLGLHGNKTLDKLRQVEAFKKMTEKIEVDMV